MRRRPFVQGTSVRKQVLRQRRIHTSFSDMWQALRQQASEMPREMVREVKGNSPAPARA